MGKTYRIEDSPDMTTWAPVETGIAGNGAIIQRFYSTRNWVCRKVRRNAGPLIRMKMRFEQLTDWTTHPQAAVKRMGSAPVC
ncbi:MAG: hypothetical protein NTW21_16895 [Verrucomicrobia bacterium]|nr:hypothetical protein [Verrucomicrobiota bacterium]